VLTCRCCGYCLLVWAIRCRACQLRGECAIDGDANASYSSARLRARLANESKEGVAPGDLIPPVPGSTRLGPAAGNPFCPRNRWIVMSS